MALTANNKGGGSDIPLMDSGINLGTCRMLIDLGHQENEWKGEVKIQHQVFIQFEVHGETIEVKDDDGNVSEVARAMGKFYTLSLGDKANLRRDLESWRGKPFTDAELSAFDIEKLLEAPAQLQIVKKKKNDGSEKNDIANVMAVMKGVNVPELTLPLVKFSFEDHDELTDDIPKGIQAIIRQSQEWKALEGMDQVATSADEMQEVLDTADELLDEPPF